MTGKESLTAETVARVRQSWEQYPDRYETIFDQIGGLTLSARTALQNGSLQELGELMNLCHGYLNALQLSTPKLEDLTYRSQQRCRRCKTYRRWRWWFDGLVPGQQRACS